VHDACPACCPPGHIHTFSSSQAPTVGWPKMRAITRLGVFRIPLLGGRVQFRLVFLNLVRSLAIACATPVVALLTVTCAALIAFPERPQAPSGSIRFTDVTKKSGLNFQQSHGDRHLDNIVEGTGTGVCVFDYDNDGFLDVYFPNGKWTEGLSDHDSRDLRGKLKNHLFRNNGDGTFTDVTVEAGLGGRRYSAGCAATCSITPQSLDNTFPYSNVFQGGLNLQDSPKISLNSSWTRAEDNVSFATALLWTPTGVANPIPVPLASVSWGADMVATFASNKWTTNSPAATHSTSQPNPPVYPSWQQTFTNGTMTCTSVSESAGLLGPGASHGPRR